MPVFFHCLMFNGGADVVLVCLYLEGFCMKLENGHLG